MFKLLSPMLTHLTFIFAASHLNDEDKLMSSIVEPELRLS